ncbi:MAG: alanine dehydrogenase [Gammaproteobacteria bacterium]|nr:alanine dehydrogenase [Gammaproteobacteria bacterium]
MEIGIPRELKIREGRVALVPAAVASLVVAGHQVFVESDAGMLSGYDNAAYVVAGAQIVGDSAALYAQAQLIVKVKEPIAEELVHLGSDHLLFSYLHLATNDKLANALARQGVTAIAFETVRDESGRLPLLAPMSDIAGRIAIQVGTNLLHYSQGGKGILLGGVAGSERGRVVIIGAGTAGFNAASMAAAMGAEVIVFDRQRQPLERARALAANVTALYAYPDTVQQAVISADLVVGAVLLAGQRAPHVVSAKTVKAMSAGSVIVDIAIDQGGCIETSRPTSYDAPTYTVDGVIHFAVTNIPGAVPRSASQALSAVIVEPLLRLCQANWRQYHDLVGGINVDQGKIVHSALID